MGWTQIIEPTKGRSTLELFLDAQSGMREAVVSHGMGRDVEGGVLWLALRSELVPWWSPPHVAEVTAWAVLYRRAAQSFTYKVVSEEMGPGIREVPDKVWQALTPILDGDRFGHAHDWRALVAEHRRVTAGQVRRRPKAGEVVTFERAAWGDLGRTFRFEGKSVFRELRDGVPSYDRYRLRGWTTVGYVIGEAA